MKTLNFNNLPIISLICFFFLGCSSTQLVDISKDEQLNDLLDNIGQVELKINENIKEAININTSKAEGDKCPVCWKISKNKCERHGSLN